jgi:hypothetical protein
MMRCRLLGSDLVHHVAVAADNCPRAYGAPDLIEVPIGVPCPLQHAPFEIYAG